MLLFGTLKWIAFKKWRQMVKAEKARPQKSI